MLLLSLSATAGLPVFADRSAAIGAVEIRSREFGGDGRQGVAVLDFDNDGDLDLYLANGIGQPNALYRNDGQLVFTEVGAEVGADHRGGTSGIVAADLDGDGWVDLVTTGDGGLHHAEDTRPVVLHNDGDGTFTDLTAESGIVGAETNLGLTVGDIDGDGDLDVFMNASGSLLTRTQHVNVLYRNDGGMRFTEVAAEAGVDTRWGACASTFTHLDDDDALDLLVANCNDVNLGLTPFELFRNQGDGTFTDIAAEAEVWGLGAWMGLAIADFDGDAYLDFFSTNVGYSPVGELLPHALYRARGDGTWEDVAQDARVGNFEYGWGTSAADFDNDGDLDLYYAGSGPRHDEDGDGLELASPGHLFENLGDGTFADPVQPRRVDDLLTSGVVEADLDGNGFSDLVVTASRYPDVGAPGFPVLLANEGTGNHWLAVRLRGSGPNTMAVGALVHAVVDGRVQVREVQGGSSFLSVNSPWPAFGLGAAREAQVCVRWPGGAGEDFGVLGADKLVDLVQGEGLAPTPCTRNETSGDGEPTDTATIDGATDTGTAPTDTGTPPTDTGLPSTDTAVADVTTDSYRLPDDSPDPEVEEGPSHRAAGREGCGCDHGPGPVGWVSLLLVGSLLIGPMRASDARSTGRQS